MIDIDATWSYKELDEHPLIGKRTKLFSTGNPYTGLRLREGDLERQGRQ
jgi:hypothetical protein